MGINEKEDPTMKIMTNIKTLAALLMAGAAFTACSSSDEIIEQPANPTAPKVYTMVIKASKGGDAKTRALELTGEDNKTLSAYWIGGEDGEKIDVGQNGEKIGTATAEASGDGETTITATLTSAPTTSDDIVFYLGGGNLDYTGQVGLLTGTGGNSISEKYDYAWGVLYSGNFTVNGYDVNLNDDNYVLDFTVDDGYGNKGNVGQAVVKFTLVDKGNSDAPINATSLTIHDSKGSLIQSDKKITQEVPTYGDVTISPAGTTNVIYAALAGVNESNLTLTASDGTDTYTYTKSNVTFNRGQYYEITVKMTKQAAAPTGALTGQFTISNDNGTTTRQVVFSQGNLQAVFAEAGSTCTWKFADNQYDYIGNNAANTSINGNGSVSAAGTVDMFGWVGASSSWTGAAMYGVSNSSSGYGNTNDNNLKSDWGNTMGDGWFTLKKDEWNYLITGRTDANQKYGFGKVGGVNGMILLPDSWTLPDGLSFTSGSGGDAWKNSYTTEQWSQMEDAGAVFLPAVGYRSGSSVSNTGSVGEYWTSTPRTGWGYFSAYYQKFDSNSHSQVGADCSTGCSVRLVRLAE